MECVVLSITAPEPGKVMQGMRGVLNPTQCVDLYKALIEDMLEFTQEMSVKRIIACTPGTSHPYFQELTKRVYVEMADHKGASTGARIKNALQLGLTKGATEVILWDGEAPCVTQKLFKEAFSRLTKTELLLGPSMDYGTYLIGCAKKAPDIFEAVRWDSHYEFVDVVKAAQNAKVPHAIYNTMPRLHKPSDIAYFLMYLQQQMEVFPRLARNTKKFFDTVPVR